MAPLLLAMLATLGAPQAPLSARVRILWFGGTGGVSQHVGLNRACATLHAQAGLQVEQVEDRGAGPRAFAHGQRLLVRPGGLSVAAFTRLLAADDLRREFIGPVTTLESPFEVAFELPGESPGETPALDALDTLPGASRARRRLVRLVGGGESALLLEAGADAPLPRDPLAWEVRFGAEVRLVARGLPRTVIEVGRPFHDGARRVQALLDQRAVDPAQTLILAAGDDLEAWSFVATGAPDRQRPLTWRAFTQLGLDALAPGRAERTFGPEVLAAEAARAGVPLLSANAEGARWLVRDVDGVTVLLVGLTDPRAGGSDVVLGLRGALGAARRALGRRADLVVAFGALGGETRAAIEGAGLDLDLLLADFGDRGLAPARVLSALASDDARVLRARDRQPLPTAAAGRRLGLAEVYFTRAAARAPWTLRAVESRAMPVPGTAPAEPQLARAVAAVRQAAYAPAQRRLLPDPGPLIDADPTLRARFEADPDAQRGVWVGRMPGRLTPRLWREAVARALGARFGAEVVVLPELPYPWALAGPVSRLQAAANLNVPDTLVRVTIEAKQLASLAQAPLVVVGLAGDTVRGRPVAPRERYTVLTTEALRADPRWQKALAGSAQRRFDRPADARRARVSADPDGSPALLRESALAALGRAGRDDARVSALLREPREPPTRWLVDLRDLRLGLSDYSVFGPRAPYAGVRETRVTTGENVALDLRGDVALLAQAATLDWVNRAAFQFAEVRYEAEDQETADQLLLESELRLRALAVARDVAPYAVAQFATEFTPTQRTLDDGRVVDNPRKKRLDGSIGLVWQRGWIEALRVGALVGHDFAETDPDPQAGLLGGAVLAGPLGPFRARLASEVRWFIPGVGEPTPTELGGWLSAKGTLDVPLFGGLGLGVFVDVYGYLGTSASTTTPGASLISGATLRFDRIFKL